jgi:hypothetical protein
VGGNTALKVPRQCPLVLLVKVAGNKVKRWKVKKVTVGEGLLGLCSRGEKLSSWTVQHRDEEGSCWGRTVGTVQQRGVAEQLDCAAS